MALQLPNNSILSTRLRTFDTEMCVAKFHEEVCCLLRTPAHIYAEVGDETVIITGCNDSSLSIIRGVDGTKISEWPPETPVCFVRAVYACDDGELKSTEVRECCKVKADETV